MSERLRDVVRRQFAVVTLRVAPRPRGAGFAFVDLTKGGVIPHAYVPSVEAGASTALARGVREGVPVVDVELTLLDGQVHAHDSSALAFEVAASLAVQQAVLEAGLIRLEPLAEATVHTPEATLGAALGELAARGASVVKVAAGTRSEIVAMVPLAKTFGLVTTLRSRTAGRGSVSLRVAGFEPVKSEREGGL